MIRMVIEEFAVIERTDPMVADEVEAMATAIRRLGEHARQYS